MKHPSRDRFLLFCLGSLSFSFGFFAYLGIEKLYKSRLSHSPTHWSMGLVAGLAFLYLLAIDKKQMPIFVKALAGGLFITLLELVTGVILNLHFHLGIWDYSNSFGDFKGQICPLFSLIWCFASFAIICINRLFTRLILRPHT